MPSASLTVSHLPCLILKANVLGVKPQAALWGLPLLESWESKQAEPLNPNLLFAGQYFDQESGLAYNRFRYYDPQTGCYLKSDPIGLAGGETPYAYVHNPMGWIDPFGLAKCKLSTADKTKLGPAPSDMKKPHYHHVVREKAPKNWKPENKKYVTDAQDILKKYGIDKDKDLRNFVWAENGSGVHTVEKAKEVYQKTSLIREQRSRGSRYKCSSKRAWGYVWSYEVAMEVIKEYYQTLLNDDVNAFIALENKYGLDVFHNENISIPVECATYNAFEICKYIYQKGIPVDEVINPFQHNALYKAINIGNLAFAEWLINHGSNPNGNILANGTPMYSIMNNVNRILLELTF